MRPRLPILSPPATDQSCLEVDPPICALLSAQISQRAENVHPHPNQPSPQGTEAHALGLYDNEALSFVILRISPEDQRLGGDHNGGYEIPERQSFDGLGQSALMEQVGD